MIRTFLSTENVVFLTNGKYPYRIAGIEMQIGAYIELPAIAGKALTKVVLTGASGASSTSEASITDTAGADVAGGSTQVVGTGVATYALSGTAENTSYRITITKNNCQFAKIELYYGEGGGSTPSTPTLSVNPASLSFAAKDSAKTISCTVGNASGYTVGATSSDPTNFPAVASGTTVTVTPTENTASSSRSATITVYLTNDGGSTKVATKTVSVTQAAAGGSGTSEGKSLSMTNLDIINNGTTTITENQYGTQNVDDPASYYKWSINGIEFAGARICKANSSDYAGLIQMQGNESDKAKQGFLGNVTDLGKITKVVIVSKNIRHEPTEHLYMGTSAYTLGQNAQTRTSMTQDGQTYTETFEVNGDFGFFTISNDKVGAFYVESVTIYYE